MANAEHVKILRQGTEIWNRWRYKNKNVLPNLSGADLSKIYLPDANLQKADLRRSNLSEALLPEANLSEAKLCQANLQGVSLEKATLRGADLSEADLCGALLYEANLRNATLARAKLADAVLTDADLSEANLHQSDFSNASLNNADLGEANLEEAVFKKAILADVDLSKANCRGVDFDHAILTGARLYWTDFSGAVLTDTALALASLIETNFENVDLSRSWVYGTSVWNPNLTGTIQHDLVITSSHTDLAAITVDDLELAQFIYLLTRSEKIRNVIDTIGEKSVLILGRFTSERKAVLDALREELRTRNYVPILFDFEKPSSRDLTETVVTLAHLSRFVIADLTNPSSVPHELMSFVRDSPSVAVLPLINKGEHVYAMFEHLQRYQWVLPIFEYESQEQLIANLREVLIPSIEEKVDQLRSGS